MLRRNLYHATPIWNLPGIVRVGIDPIRSRGRLPVVWLVEWSFREWLAKHLALHHGCQARDLVFLRVQISRKAIRRRRRGVWHTTQLVPVHQVLDAWRQSPSGNWLECNSWRVQLAAAAAAVPHTLLKQIVRSVVAQLVVSRGPS